MAGVVSDDDHAVQSSTVCGLHKADTGSDPNMSYLLFVCYAANVQVYRWIASSARDDFYKKLVEAMGS